VERLFSEIDDVGIVRLNVSDIVRHPLIAKLVAAYQRAGDA
jgi:phosphate starvation-inducible protein PhoH